MYDLKLTLFRQNKIYIEILDKKKNSIFSSVAHLNDNDNFEFIASELIRYKKRYEKFGIINFLNNNNYCVIKEKEFINSDIINYTLILTAKSLLTVL